MEYLREFDSLENLRTALVDKGCTKAIVKVLAKRQDNSKNQINLGGNVSLLDLLPGEIEFRGLSTSTRKRNSVPGLHIPQLNMKFSWLDPSGCAHEAPKAKIIHYTQYPENRASALLAGQPVSPQSLRHNRSRDFGRRALFIGFNDTEAYGAVITDHDGTKGELFRQIEQMPISPVSQLLHEFSLTASTHRSLLGEIMALRGKPHESVTLDSNGTVKPFRSNQGGGYTLEALLGVPRNAVSGPDKDGHEIKSVSSAKVTMITTEPDAGYRHDNGVRNFLRMYGWAGRSKGHENDLVFNGKHVAGTTSQASGARLHIANWDDVKASAVNGDPYLQLLHSKTRKELAVWSANSIKKNWTGKHSASIFVETIPVRQDDSRYPSHYEFGRIVVGRGTSAMYLFDRIAAGDVYLDPADELKASTNKVSSRVQWRLGGSIRTSRAPHVETQLPARLAHLYDELTVHDTDGTEWVFRNGVHVPQAS